MSKQYTREEILTQEEYALANIGRSWHPTYDEYVKMEKRKELTKAIQVLVKFNEIPFYPNQKESFTELISGYSHIQTNQMNDIIDKFQSRIKQWDYREE